MKSLSKTFGHTVITGTTPQNRTFALLNCTLTKGSRRTLVILNRIEATRISLKEMLPYNFSDCDKKASTVKFVKSIIN